jgi:short-subunit dehydrogenase
MIAFNETPTPATNKLATTYGPWAVVTGASSGIGEEFAYQLAESGLNLVLVARRAERLERLALHLRRNNVQVQVVAADLSDADGVTSVLDATAELEVGLLINNAGAELHGAFVKQDATDLQRITDLNISAPMRLAHHYTQRMTRRGRGGVIFIASTLGHGAVPYFAHYAATKAYILNLGEALHHEVAPHGVDVTVLAPGLTETEMKQQIAESGVDFSRTPIKPLGVTETVTTGLEALGRRSSVIPGMRNNLFAFMNKRLLSRNGGARMFGKMLKKAMPADAI